jgi:hypothetical protein
MSKTKWVEWIGGVVAGALMISALVSFFLLPIKGNMPEEEE